MSVAPTNRWTWLYFLERWPRRCKPVYITVPVLCSHNRPVATGFPWLHTKYYSSSKSKSKPVYTGPFTFVSTHFSLFLSAVYGSQAKILAMPWGDYALYPWLASSSLLNSCSAFKTWRSIFWNHSLFILSDFFLAAKIPWYSYLAINSHCNICFSCPFLRRSKTSW